MASTIDYYGMIGSALAAQPGQFIQANSTDGIYAYDNYTQQQMNHWATTTVGSTSAISLGALGQAWQQVVEPAKKAMSFLEELRDEISGWHGSLGTI